jgi:hypothetical protein
MPNPNKRKQARKPGGVEFLASDDLGKMEEAPVSSVVHRAGPIASKLQGGAWCEHKACPEGVWCWVLSAAL